MSEWNGIPIWLIVLSFGFIALRIYLQDGWRRLAKHYRTDQPASGKSLKFQWATIGWIFYRGTLTMTTNSEGLFLEPIWLYSFMRPRLFIPWKDFHNATYNTYFFWRNVKVQVGNPPLVGLRLPTAIFEQSEGRKVLK